MLPPETWLDSPWLFHRSMPNPRRPKYHMVSHRGARCDDIFIGVSDPALCCCTAINVCFCTLWEQESEKNLRRTNGVGVWDRTHLSLPSIPQSNQPEPGQTRQSPAGHGQLPHRGLDGDMPDALIKLMLFVYFFCLDASITARQEHCESRFLSGEPWTLATGVLREGCVLSWEHWGCSMVLWWWE